MAIREKFVLIIRSLNNEFIRFALVGVVATGIHYGVYYLLQLFINVNIAYTIGYLISWFCNFFLSAKFTFKTIATINRGLGFAGSHLINYFLHLLFLNIFLLLGLSSAIAPIPTFCCVFPINFFIVRFIFNKFK